MIRRIDKKHTKCNVCFAKEGDQEKRGMLEGLPTYILRNEKGVEVHVRPLGALIQRLVLPDQKGNLADVVLGFDKLEPYKDGTSPYFGVVVGRVANRIEGGRFKVGGEEYQVSLNEKGNCLHGGACGFDKAVWELVSQEEGKSVILRHVSEDGDQGFPGKVTVTVQYRLTEPSDDDHGLLLVDLSAVTTRTTPISLAQHGYFNLTGHASGSSVLKHHLHLNAAEYTSVDESLIPTGELVSTTGTPFEFPQNGDRQIGERIAEVAGGYDHNFVLNQNVERKLDGNRLNLDGSPRLHLAAVLEERELGRKVELSTSAPGVQFYSGNFLDGSLTKAQGTKDGATYNKHGGLCLETQGFPNAVNQENFPSNVLKPGDTYKHVMVYRFSS